MICLILFILAMNSCENENLVSTINFNNTSKSDVYVHGSYNYPDTLLTYEFPSPTLNPQIFKVGANSSSEQALETRGNYLAKLKDIERFVVFVFDAEVLETTPWDTVKVNYMVLKRYDLSLEDLESLNWTITYP